MCLIIHRPAGASNVPNDVLSYNRQRNNDGFGIAWRDSANVMHHKKFGPKDYDAFHALLKSIDGNNKTEYVAHFRMATTGAPCEALSHPFVYNDGDEDVAIFHNGIINIKADKGESDTSTFVSRVIALMEKRWWRNPAYRFLVESSISGSRMLVMAANETIRLNERLWNQKNGIWYSTTAITSYQQPKYNGSFIPAGAGMAGSGWSPASGRAVGIPADVKASWDKVNAANDAKFGPLAEEDGVMWTDGGHTVSPLSFITSIPKNEDVEIEVECDDCGAAGTAYVIDGSTFFDLKHMDFFVDDEDEDEDADAETMAMVLAQ